MSFIKYLVIAASVVFYSTAHAAEIISMSIVDVTGDTVSGAFRFGAISFEDTFNDDGTLKARAYAGTSNFNSNGEIIARRQQGETTNGGQLPGAGTDGGILFGQIQDVNAITSGFNFGNLGPFVPRTLSPPEGSVNFNPVTSQYELSLTSFHFAGLFQGEFLFSLPPDPEPAEPCSGTEVQSGGICVRFLEQIAPNQYNYQIRWSHLITEEEDEGFAGFNARWGLEGVITTATAPVPVPAAAWLLVSGLGCLFGFARSKKLK